MNVPCGTCVKGCQCSAVSEVGLSDVDQILGVRIDGVDYDPCGMVAVYDRSRVVRIDGGAWPVCQEFGKYDGLRDVVDHGPGGAVRARRRRLDHRDADVRVLQVVPQAGRLPLPR